MLLTPPPETVPSPGQKLLDELKYDCILAQMNKKQISKRPMTPKQAAACCGPVDELLTPQLFKALGDPTRVKLLACLAKCARSCSVGEIAECCSVDLSVVSRHLGLLEQAGILESRKQGRAVFYEVRYQDLVGSLRALADAIENCCPTSVASACEGGRCG